MVLGFAFLVFFVSLFLKQGTSKESSNTKEKLWINYESEPNRTKYIFLEESELKTSRGKEDSTMALIKREMVDDCTQSTEADFSEVKNEAIEIDDSNIWAEKEELTCGPQGIYSILPVKSEPVDSSFEDGGGCGGVMKEDIDESKSGNELENPAFVSVKEELDNETLLDQGTFKLSDSAQDCVGCGDDMKKDFNLSESGNESENPLFVTVKEEPVDVTSLGQCTFQLRDSEQGPTADTNVLPRNAHCASVMLHSQSLHYCHHCTSCGTQEDNPAKCLRGNRTQCLYKMPLKKRSVRECEIPYSIASTSEVKERIHVSADKEGKIEQTGEMQTTKVDNKKSLYKRSSGSSGKLSVSGTKIKQRSLSLNTSSKQILQSRSSKRTFKCGLCEKTFNKKSYLIAHMRSHTGERPYKCRQCEKAFICNGGLTVHMRWHTGERPFKCDQCEKTFAQSSNLTVHMRQHTGEKPFNCNQCGKSFAGNGTLTTHMRLHTGEKPFKCNECGSAFNQKSILSMHMRVHTGEKPFQCNECGKAFPHRGTLTSHMRRHTGEKPFSCNQCGKSFVESGALTTHMRQHTGEKPFKCNECGKAFRVSGMLTRHMRQHTREKPFKCDDCGREFHFKCNLTIHMRQHTGEKPFSCN